MKLAVQKHADGAHRCSWCGDDAQYMAYHDDEWGRPTADDRYLFEKLVLEGFQSGLAWITILRKREAFRAAFKQFDIERVARFGTRDVERLLGNEGIVRHRGKIESAINNARCAARLIDDCGSLAAFVWRYEPGAKSRPKRMLPALAARLTTSPESTALSKDLKQRGFGFVGPTTMYAFMQAVGLVNDHLEGCDARTACETQRAQFVRPG
jgi:DNA-3-methyladenine glycosylase I